MSVDQELENIVAKTFSHTERLLEEREVTLDLAVQSVEQIMFDLTCRWPQDAEWIRTRLTQWRRDHGN